MRKIVHVAFAGAMAGTLAFAAPAVAQQKSVKIGFITTLSGPLGVIGKHMRDAAELALDHNGRKVGGLDVEMVYGDDQVKPDVGVQVAEQMIKRDQVDLMAGIIWSNVMMAAVPVITGAGKIMVGTNAGASPLAGSQCNELYFSTSWNNDQSPEAMGKFLQDSGVSGLYVMAPNYQAGKDMVAGLKRYYKGSIVEEIYTKLGQQDYQAEITQLRAKNPKAVFVFYPGGMGIQFIRQYVQAGLRERIPLYSVFTVDQTTLPALKDAAIGQYEAGFWSPNLKNPVNEKFVTDFRKKYGYTPSPYAAQTYDGIMLIDAAVRGVKGNVKDTKAMVAELRKANFKSLRGDFKYNTNQFPIQNFYIQEAVKDPEGMMTVKTIATAVKDGKDPYYEKCPMK
jgi:branched-chain amino acid transport system substrate-binding protein